MPTCLIASISSDAAVQRLEQWCRDAGVTPVTFVAGRDVDPPSPTRIDGLMVVGGAVSPYDERVVPTRTLGPLIARMSAHQKPLLGIGGGAHLVSVSLGGRPTTDPDIPPFRLVALSYTVAGCTDAILRHAPEVLHWTECSRLRLTELPVGAVPLAVGPEELPAVVRIGERAWILQGHPEMDEAAWARSVEHADPAVRAEFEALRGRFDPICAGWEPVFTAFFHLVGGCPSDPRRPQR